MRRKRACISGGSASSSSRTRSSSSSTTQAISYIIAFLQCRKRDVECLSARRFLGHLRAMAERRGPVGAAVARPIRCRSVQEAFGNDAADETRGGGGTQSAGERGRPGSWHSKSGWLNSRNKRTAKAMKCRSMSSLEISRKLVGAGRFERPTPCAQGRCATRLRYAPTIESSLILDHLRQRPGVLQFRTQAHQHARSTTSVASSAGSAPFSKARAALYTRSRASCAPRPLHDRITFSNSPLLQNSPDEF
jgi:hypothetical protein